MLTTTSTILTKLNQKVQSYKMPLHIYMYINPIYTCTGLYMETSDTRFVNDVTYN